MPTPTLPPPDQPPKPMPFADKVFLAELAVFGGAFGTGLFMIFESTHTWAASGVTVVGLAGVGASLIDHFSTAVQARTRFVVTAVIGIGIWGLLGYDIYDRYLNPTRAAVTNSVTISGTADVVGGADYVGVQVGVNLPYEAFCTAEWNSSCYPQEKKDGLVIFAFNTQPPQDGGKIEWHVTPTPLLKAYQDEVNVVTERERTIKDLQTQIGHSQGH